MRQWTRGALRGTLWGNGSNLYTILRSPCCGGAFSGLSNHCSHCAHSYSDTGFVFNSSFVVRHVTDDKREALRQWARGCTNYVMDPLEAEIVASEIVDLMMAEAHRTADVNETVS